MPTGIYVRTDTTRRALSLSAKKKRRPMSEETKQKISKSNKGKKASLETREKMSIRAKLHRRENSPHWKGGISLDKKEYKRYCEARRRAQKKGAGGSHTFGEWDTLKAQFNWTCPSCGKKEPDISLTEDHIIPLSKGGSDNIENIQPLCKHCNFSKYTKIIIFLKPEMEE